MGRVFLILIFLAGCSSGADKSDSDEEFAWLLNTPIVNYDDHALVQRAADAWQIGIKVRQGTDCRIRVHITDPLCSSVFSVTEQINFVCPVSDTTGRYIPENIGNFPNGWKRGDILVVQSGNAIAVELILTHEIGHALGFNHSDSERDIMFPIGLKTNRPSEDELATVRSVHLDQSGTAGALASGRMAWALDDLDFCYSGSAF